MVVKIILSGGLYTKKAANNEELVVKIFLNSLLFLNCLFLEIEMLARNDKRPCFVDCLPLLLFQI